MGSVFPNRVRVLAIIAGILVCSAVFLSPALAGTIERVSVGLGGAQPNGNSYNVVVSADGRFVAFASKASNLVSGDTNGCADVFVYDRTAHTMERVSVASDGTGADGRSDSPAISGDGQLVVFRSSATNLAPGDTSGNSDIFLRDRVAGTTVRVTETAQPYPGTSLEPTISADGRFVAFVTNDRTFLPGLPTSFEFTVSFEVSVKDLLTGAYECPSFPYGLSSYEIDVEAREPTLSADGRYVAFKSQRRGIVPLEEDRLLGWLAYGIYVRDRLTGAAVLAMPRGSIPLEFPPMHMCLAPYRDPVISSDGSFVAFDSGDDGLLPEDTNWVPDVFLYRLADRTTERVSMGFDGGESLDCSQQPSISADGRCVAFISCATNLVADCPPFTCQQVFIRDQVAGLTELATVGIDGAGGNNMSLEPSISSDGRVLAFTSDAANLVSGDSNGLSDVYVYCAAPPGNTEPGANVPVSPGEGIEMTFGEVTGAGDTTVTVSATPPGGPPSGFRFLGAYYDIVTTAGYSGTITISFPYDPAGMTDKKEERLRVLHYDPAVADWQDVTVTVDTVNHLVIASVTSLSWFGLAYPAYEFKGFLPPIAEAAGKPFKRGSTIPIKFRISDAAGKPVTDAIARLTVSYAGDGAPPGEPEVVSTAAGDFGDLFRYDATDDLYIFNLSTKDSSYLDHYTYAVNITLDGEPCQSAAFSLK